ncbi:MAG: hypothetical protein ACLFRV_12310 [Acidimicrobiales bacterium]
MTAPSSPSSTLRAVIDPWYTAPVVPVLQRRRRDLVDSLDDGRVLVLTGPPAVMPDDVPDTVDHVVTVGWLGAADDLDAAIAGLVARLAPGGWMHVIEPTRGPGATARAQRLAAPAARARTGWRIGRDVPGAIRRCGWVVTDVERFSMPVSSTVLRPWVHARARRRAGGPVRETGR